MIAGGIGITPLRSILKSHEKRKGDSIRFILLYGNLNREDIAFRDELANLNLPDYRLVHVLTDPAGMENAYQGYITAEIISREVSEKETATYMVSGPPTMVEVLRKALTSLGVTADRIRTDIFMGYD